MHGQHGSRRSTAKLLHTHTHTHTDVLQSCAILYPALPNKYETKIQLYSHFRKLKTKQDKNS